MSLSGLRLMLASLSVLIGLRLTLVSFCVCLLSGVHNLTNKAPKMKIVEFANSVEPDEADHHEPPHVDLHFLCSVL